MNSDCLICTRIEKIKSKENPYFLVELQTGYAVLGDYQFYRGYILFLCKKHVPELHLLDEDYRMKFLKEMSIVAETIYKAFYPQKLNYELLGNSHSHMHWHLFPRYKNDPNLTKPIWITDKNVRNNEETRPDSEMMRELKNTFLAEFNKHDK